MPTPEELADQAFPPPRQRLTPEQLADQAFPPARQYAATGTGRNKPGRYAGQVAQQMADLFQPSTGVPPPTAALRPSDQARQPAQQFGTRADEPGAPGPHGAVQSVPLPPPGSPSGNRGDEVAAQNAAVAWDRVAGPRTFDPALRRRTQPRNLLERAGRIAQTFPALGMDQEAADKIQHDFRVLQMQGRVPRGPQLAADPQLGDAQAEHVNAGIRKAGQFINDAPALVNFAAEMQKLAGIQPQTPQQNAQLQQQKQQLVKSYLDTLDPQRVLSDLKAHNVSLTPSQRQGLLQDLAWQRYSFVRAPEVARGLGTGAALTAALAWATAPFAELAQAGLRAAGPAVVRGVERVAGPEAAAAVGRVAGSAGGRFAGQTLIEGQHAAAFGAGQVPVQQAITNPQDRLQDVPGQIVQGYLGGLALGAGTHAGGQALGAGLNRLLATAEKPLATAELALRLNSAPANLDAAMQALEQQGRVRRTPKGWMPVEPPRAAGPALPRSVSGLTPEQLADQAFPRVQHPKAPPPLPAPSGYTPAVGDTVRYPDLPDLPPLKVTAIRGKTVELAGPQGQRVTATAGQLQPAGRQEVLAGPPVFPKPLYDMTPAELDAAHGAMRDYERGAAVEVFGPEAAKRYEMLQRSANNSVDLQRADAAGAELHRMEAGLTPEQQRRLFGIGETGPTAEDVSDFRRSVYDVHAPETPADLVHALRDSITTLAGEEHTDAAAMSHRGQVAYATLQHAFREARRNGWDTGALSQAALQGAAGQFHDPEDAAFVLRRFLQSSGGAPAREPGILPTETIPGETARGPQPQPPDAGGAGPAAPVGGVPEPGPRRSPIRGGVPAEEGPGYAVTARGGIKLPSRRALTFDEISDVERLHTALRQGQDEFRAVRAEMGEERAQHARANAQALGSFGVLDEAVQGHREWIDEQYAKQHARFQRGEGAQAQADFDNALRDKITGSWDLVTHRDPRTGQTTRYYDIGTELTPEEKARLKELVVTPARQNREFVTASGTHAIEGLIDANHLPYDFGRHWDAARSTPPTVRPPILNRQDLVNRTLAAEQKLAAARKMGGRGIRPEEADAFGDIFDARAEAWSKAAGQPKQEYYRTRLRDVVAGGTPKRGALLQIAPYEEAAGLPDGWRIQTIRAWNVDLGLVPGKDNGWVLFDAQGKVRGNYGTREEAIAAGRARGGAPYHARGVPSREAEAGRLSAAAGRAREPFGRSRATATYVDRDHLSSMRAGDWTDVDGEPYRVLEKLPGGRVVVEHRQNGTKHVLSLGEPAPAQRALFQPGEGTHPAGSVEFQENGRALVRLFKQANVSTLVHEAAHIFRRDLEGADLKTVEQWAGVQAGQWEAAHEEKFARGFERYLRDGQTPTEGLRAIFERFRTWLTQIYRTLKDGPLADEIPAAVRQVYDRLLGGDGAAASLSSTSETLDQALRNQIRALGASATPESLAGRLAAQGHKLPEVTAALDRLERAGSIHRDPQGHFRVGAAPSGAGEDLTLRSSDPNFGQPGLSFDAPAHHSNYQPRDEAGQFDAKRPAPTSPRIQPEPLPGGQPKRLQQIVVDFGQALGKRVPVARPGRGAAGSYFPGTAKTVVRYSGDLDTTAHEVAHFLDDKYGLGDLGSQALAPFDHELIPQFSQHGSVAASGPRSALSYQRAEGVAEWVRAHLVNPDAARKAAPQFYQHFAKTVPPEARTALQGFSNDIRRWAGQSATERTLSNVRMTAERPSLARSARTFLGDPAATFQTTPRDKVTAQVLDDLWPVVKGIRKAKGLRGVVDLLPEADPELGMRLHGGLLDRLRVMLDQGPVTPRDQPVKGLEGGFARLLSPFDQRTEAALRRDMGDAVTYMISERVKHEGDASAAAGGDPHTLRISGAGGGLRSDYATAIDTLSELRQDPVRLKRIEAGAELYRKWSSWLLDYMVDSGRLSKSSAAAIRADNPFYVDLHRVMDELDIEVPHGAPTARRLGSSNEPIHRRTGSSRTIEDPYVNLLAQTYAVVRESDRNQVMRQFRDLLTDTRGMHQGEQRDFASIGYRGVEGDKDTIPIWVDGEKEHWKFEEGIHQALKGWGEIADTGLAQRFIQGIASVMRMSITHSPDFAVRNLIRDTQERSVLSDVGSKPWDVLRGLTGKGVEELRVAGGAQAGHYLRDRVAYHEMLGRTIRRLAQDRRSIVVLPERLAGGYQELLERGELANRLAEFNRAREYAKTKLKYDDFNADRFAAGKARGLMDFAVAGSTVRKINRYVPFTNAHVQGLVRGARSAKAAPALTAARWATYIVGPALLTYAWNASQGKDTLNEYLQLPDYLRDMFYSFKVAPDTWMRIPKPFEIGTLGSGVERAIDRAAGNKRAFDGYPASLFKSFAPVDETVFGGPTRPILENMVNYDLFRGRNIVPPSENDKLLELRKGVKHASRLGQLGSAALSGPTAALRTVGINADNDPRKVDHAIEGFFGGAGRAALNLSDTGRKDQPRNPAVQYGNALTGILASSPAGQAKDVQYVVQRAKELGLENMPGIGRRRSPESPPGLPDLLDNYYRARTTAEKDHWAKMLRLQASRLRPVLEKMRPGVRPMRP